MTIIMIVFMLIVLNVGWKIGKWVDRRVHPEKHINFKLSKVPLSANEWSRFSALAVAKGVQTKSLIAEALKFYVEAKTK